MLSENPNKIISFQKKEIKKERWEEENGRRKEEVKEGRNRRKEKKEKIKCLYSVNT
jgi:hypothetical protein